MTSRDRLGAAMTALGEFLVAVHADAHPFVYGLTLRAKHAQWLQRALEAVGSRAAVWYVGRGEGGFSDPADGAQ